MQLVAVTQKTAERSYREHIEQQIQIYQRRCGPSPAQAAPPFSGPGVLGAAVTSVGGPGVAFVPSGDGCGCPAFDFLE